MRSDYLRTFTTQDRYALPILHALNRDARLLAAKVRVWQTTPRRGSADPAARCARTFAQADQRTVAAGGKPSKLNDVARVLNRSFNACVTDRYGAWDRALG